MWWNSLVKISICSLGEEIYVSVSMRKIKRHTMRNIFISASNTPVFSGTDLGIK